MTLYLDTSSLVKLYVAEAGSDAVGALVDDAAIICTSAVAYAEARAAFARLRRDRALTRARAALAARQLDLDWASYFVIEVTTSLARAAGVLADRIGVRGFDAIHLASFEHLVARAEDDVHFSSADDRLVRAAKRLG